MATESNEGVWLHARSEVTLVELARTAGLSEQVVRELVEYGAIVPCGGRPGEWAFSAECLRRVRSAARLGRDLELETSAVALVLAFLERIERLETELRRLEAESGTRR